MKKQLLALITLALIHQLNGMDKNDKGLILTIMNVKETGFSKAVMTLKGFLSELILHGKLHSTSMA